MESKVNENVPYKSHQPDCCCSLDLNLHYATLVIAPCAKYSFMHQR